MTESMSPGTPSGDAVPGEDFVCRACGCEVMVKHWGQPREHADGGAFVCHCGQEMQPEHPGQVRQGASFNQEDFLGHGGGASEASGAGGMPSPGSSPGSGL
jgi:hypothetical protein